MEGHRVELPNDAKNERGMKKGYPPVRARANGGRVDGRRLFLNQTHKNFMEREKEM